MIEYKDTYPDPRLKSAAEIMEEEAECGGRRERSERSPSRG